MGRGSGAQKAVAARARLLDNGWAMSEPPNSLLDRAELLELLKLSQADNLRLIAQIEHLQELVQTLQQRIEQSSRNSSAPPSSDPPHKRKLRPKRTPSSKKQGAQPGHKGHRFTPLTPDKIVDLKPESCHACHASLQGQDPTPQTHQVIDIPPIKPEVIDYHIHQLPCRCGAHTKAKLPLDVPRQNFGPRVRALYIHLIANFRMSRRQSQELLETVLGTKISLGVLSECEGQISCALTEIHENLREKINDLEVVHIDETGWYKKDELYWLWYAGNETMSYFKIEKSRDQKVAIRMSKGTEGIKVTDRFSAYTIIDPDKRQLCWAHLKRDFTRLEKVKYEVGESSGEALEEQISKLFEILSREGENWKSDQETRLKILDIKGTIRYILSTTEGREKSRSWIGRVLKEYEQFWTWMNHDHVPLTNNEAERSLRHGVIWRKKPMEINQIGVLILQKVF